MRHFYFVFILLFGITSCKSSKQATTKRATTPVKITNNSIPTSKANAVIKYAKTYLGTPYKYGGLNRNGLDCSGLVYLSFKNEGIIIPRVSYNIAKEGERIPLNKVAKGDLLFFKTTKKNKKRINHVGLVVDVNRKAIEFIHSTSSKGVTTSLLSDHYWNKAFVEARRIL